MGMKRIAVLRSGLTVDRALGKLLPPVLVFALVVRPDNGEHQPEAAAGGCKEAEHCQARITPDDEGRRYTHQQGCTDD